ncbi:MAG: VWA domain-containing protein [Deltaproteobacteria bacterium]|nr:VWA domain-containing protein [Deltaproteobacteria bacterium]
MRFLYPQYLLFLSIIPGLIAFVFWSASQRRKGLKVFGLPDLTRVSSMPLILTVAGIAFLIVSLARPQWGIEERPVETRKLDIIFGLDTSFTMNAQDERPDRLYRAKEVMGFLLGRLGGIRVGLVAFGPSSLVVCPLTTDPDALRSFAVPLDTGLFPEEGPNLGEAIETSLGLLGTDFKSVPTERARAIILLTSGEDPQVVDHPALKRASEGGIKAYTVGLGSPEGAPIPLYSRDGRFLGYKEDSSGKRMSTRLDEKVLKAVASMTGGRYYKASDRGMGALSDELLEGVEVEVGKETVVGYKDGFWGFIMAGLVFIIAGRLKSLP